MIGEAVKALPAEVLASQPQVPWRAIAKLRDLLAHHYYRVDADVIRLTVDAPLEQLADVLAPVVTAELRYRKAEQEWLDREPHGPRDDDEFPDFASMDGPLFLLGTCVLNDAVWALVGDDPLAEVLPTLARSLDGIVAGVAGEAIARVLIASFTTEYRCELPGDAEVLAGLDRSATGSPLEDALAAGLAAQGDILQMGLAVLAVLAQLCMSGSRSAVRPAA